MDCNTEGSAPQSSRWHAHLGANGNSQDEARASRPSLSLSPPAASEPDSDFGLEEAGTEADASRPGSSEDDFSDGSDYGGTKRKRQKQQPAPPAKRLRPDIDNERTRTLRSAQPSEEQSQHNGSSSFYNHGQDSRGPVTEEEESEVDEHDSQPQVVERQLSAEEQAEQLQEVQGMWQLAAILEFLHVFSAHLRISDTFTPEELEVAIVSETGQTGMLARLHQDLLKGITSRTDLSSHNWAAHFANRLKYQWVSTHLRGSPPFAPSKRQEALDYAALSSSNRVHALKLLCEIRLDKEDLRAAVEVAMKPPKAPSRPPSGKPTRSAAGKGAKPEQGWESPMELQHEPLGEDKQGAMWWYLDLGPSGQAGPSGSRLYKETPTEPHPTPDPSPPKPPKGKEAKGRGAKGRGRKGKPGQGGGLVPAPAAPSWELVASTTEELQAAGEELASSSIKGQSDVGYQILDTVVPSLVARAEAMERKAKAAAKIAAQLNNIVPDDNGHYGRSRRQRTQVNYNYDEYDRTIKDAIRGGKNEMFAGPSKPQRDWSRPPPLESRRAGLRGGKPQDPPQASPDENRPSNEQSGADAVHEDSDSEVPHAVFGGMQESHNWSDVNGNAEYAGNGMHSQRAVSGQASYVDQAYLDNVPSRPGQSYTADSNGSVAPYLFHT